MAVEKRPQVTSLSYYLQKKSEFICLKCTLWECDELATACAYRQIKPDRSKATKIKRAFIEQAKLRSAIAKLGFKKYDKRRKPDTPQRMLWRSYKEKKAVA